MRVKVCSKCKRELLATPKYFHRASANKDGFKNICKACIAKDSKKYYENNKEKIQEYKKQYRTNNKEKIAAQNKKYYEKNKEKVLATNKEWAEKNKDKMDFYKKKYYLENLEQIRERNKVYREENKEYLLKEKRKYHWENREEILRKRKMYYVENKEKFQEYSKKYNKENRELLNTIMQKRRAKIKKLPNDFKVKDWENVKLYFDNSCAYCGMTEKEHIKKFNEQLHQEHFIPVSKGGGYTIDNIIPACRSCNSSKGEKDFKVWYPEHNHYSEEKERKILKYFGRNEKHIAN